MTHSQSATHHQIILRSQDEISFKKKATIFGPLGLICPYIIRAKIFMQQAWVEAVGWDEQLLNPLREDWRLWFSELSEIERIRIPRCLKGEKIKSTSIHTFMDAS